MGDEREIFIPIQGEDAQSIYLRLRRLPQRTEPAAKPVLLLHGANNTSDAFLEPHGGLAKYLQDRGLDVWLLDWRASAHVLRQAPLREGKFASAECERALFRLDRVVSEDFPLAVEQVFRATGQRTSVVGFCLGAAALSLAIARGTLTDEHVEAVVLMTVGLFLRSPWQTWLKSREYILDQCIDEFPEFRTIDPHDLASWPEPLAEAFGRWPRELLPKDAPDWFQHLTFLYGEPFARNLVELPNAGDHFGPLHLGFYLEAAELLRRGHMPDVAVGDDPLCTRLQERFARHRLTLIGGAQGRLWHREALDVMYDWLRRVSPRPEHCEKVMLDGYAHNDLLWAPSARKDVFPRVAHGLGVIPEIQAQAAPQVAQV